MHGSPPAGQATGKRPNIAVTPGRPHFTCGTPLVMLAALVHVMAVPAPLSQVIDQGEVPGPPDFSDNNWAHNWHELITYSDGPVL